MFRAVKILTTMLIASMMAVVWYFLMDVKLEDKATIAGFSFMELVYILALICIWG